MARLRTLLIRSPGISALAGMAMLVAFAWAAPEINAHRAGSAQVGALA